MFKKSILTNSLALALIAPSFAMAEVEATIELRNETAVFTSQGQTIGQATSMLDNTTDHSGGDLMKFQNQAKIFLNGDIGEESSWHAELQLIYDAEALDDNAPNVGGMNYRGHENYTQNDFFRELYVDTEAAGWTLRLGKQQVVWGTADGIKLLDIINPTDFREVNQNVMEDSRLPIWMINAERSVGDNGNLQIVVSQSEKNKIPGLNPGGDSGHPFIMKGVDTISGQVNGFFNVAPALSKVATTFNIASTLNPGFGPSPFGLAPFGGVTVDGFASGGGVGVPFGGSGSGLVDLNGFAQYGFGGGDPNGNYNVTNLMNVSGALPNQVTWNPSNPTAAFEYMPNATFATFNTFDGANTRWVDDYEDNEANAGFRYKANLDSGLNLSVNYFYHNSANPDINLSWNNPANGEKLVVEKWLHTNGQLPTAGTLLTSYSQVPTNMTAAAAGVTVLVRDSNNNYFGRFNPTNGAAQGLTPELRFTESTHRIHSLGGSFDYALTTELPVVIRGEFLYDKDEKQAVVNKHALAIGDLTNALTMQDADMFKYVLGVDITVMTNLLVSTQFIQFVNLDYVDSAQTCFTQTGKRFDCSTYTGDLSTLHLTNGMQKAEEYKNFVSLFFSKPIGEDQLGRWNNITILEEEGGFWNRLDADYSITDQFIVKGEWNHYWGDENTTFGQLEESSNVQVGFKYIFEDY